VTSSQRCAAGQCSYTGEPFPKGTVNYEVIAVDRAGNKGTPAKGRLVVTDPRPTGASTISGRITGQRKLCKKVAASNLDRHGQPHTASVDGNGNYRIRNIPDGRYLVYPLPGTKSDLIAEPSHREVIYRGSGTHTVNYDIKDIFEG
jgi:hypothetical protein